MTKARSPVCVPFASNEVGPPPETSAPTSLWYLRVPSVTVPVHVISTLNAKVAGSKAVTTSCWFASNSIVPLGFRFSTEWVAQSRQKPIPSLQGEKSGAANEQVAPVPVNLSAVIPYKAPSAQPSNEPNSTGSCSCTRSPSSAERAGLPCAAIGTTSAAATAAIAKTTIL